MSVGERLDRVKNYFGELLFPSCCVGCGKGGEFLCKNCRQSLPVLMPPLCKKCGNSLPWDGCCTSCLRWELQIDGIRSPFRYEGIVREAVLQLKYHHLRAIAQELAQPLAEYFKRVSPPGDILFPVPLHPRRLRARGYNQSALLAEALGKLVGLPVEDRVLWRYVDTPPQARSDGATRRNNVLGAFRCNEKEVESRSVIVIDDVCTTGATLNACAETLKIAGVASVWGVALAREV
ncbi:MAG: ComF family protein [Chloroflexota bacterium]|nr:ComF family protein [Chloroflexota bacterium]